MDNKKKICVIGSLNVDLTAVIERFHAPGETVFGSDFRTYPGGKGGNQAVAAAKLGADVTMVGCLGDDANSKIWRKVMKDLDIRDLVAEVQGVPSGVALIEVDAKGENRIIVISGANMEMTPQRLDRVFDALECCDIVLLQLEIPMETVVEAAERFHRAGKIVILDPAPAAPLPDALLRNVDYLTPNETELASVSGMSTSADEELISAAAALTARGCRNVIAKVGSRGAVLVNDEGSRFFPGFQVRAVDTTAAGDSFNAGLAAALSEGKSIHDAISFANAVGALSTTAAGAQSAMPSHQEAEALMNLAQVPCSE